MAAPTKPSKVLAKTVHLHTGLDLVGSKTSFSHRDAEIQCFDWGVKVISKKTKRIIRVWAPNLKGAEELPGENGEE